MFFGKKPEPEKVSIAGLAPLMNQALDRRLGNFGTSASRIIDEIRKMKVDFDRACSDFERLDVQPYTEDLWNPNISSIKSQKTAYATAIRNAMGKLSLEVDDAPNVYSRYKIILLNVEEATNSVLKYNSNYNVVLYCYSNYLKDFKRTFSAMERYRDMLKGELDRKIDDYNAYNAIAEQVSKLEIGIEELEALGVSISAAQANLSLASAANSAEVEKNEREIDQKISEKVAQMSEERAKISGTTNRINMLTAPLERASKKFDHLSARKRQMNMFITDPMSTLREKAEYDLFREMLIELRAAVRSGSVDVKNRDEVLSAISRITESDIYFEIDSLSAIKARISDIEAEIREFERISDAIKAGRRSKEESMRQIEKMKDDVKKISASQESLKMSVEKAFLEKYSRPIQINLN